MPKYRKPKAAVPAGKYEVKVMDAKLQVSKRGNEMITLRLSAGHGPHFYDHLVFIESSDWKFANFLSAMGEDLPDGADIVPAHYIGRRAPALVGYEEDLEGRSRNTIKKWLPRKASAAEGPKDNGVDEISRGKNERLRDKRAE